MSEPYFVVIPAYVLELPISPNAKLLFGRISGLTTKKGFCYASNAHLAHGMGFDPESVKRLLRELKAQKLVSVEVERDARGEVRERRISCLKAFTPGVGNDPTPLGSGLTPPLGSEMTPPGVKNDPLSNKAKNKGLSNTPLPPRQPVDNPPSAEPEKPDPGGGAKAPGAGPPVRHPSPRTTTGALLPAHLESLGLEGSVPEDWWEMARAFVRGGPAEVVKLVEKFVWYYTAGPGKGVRGTPDVWATRFSDFMRPKGARRR